MQDRTKFIHLVKYTKRSFAREIWMYLNEMDRICTALPSIELRTIMMGFNSYTN